MSTIELKNVNAEGKFTADKSQWPEGEWTEENNYAEFTTAEGYNAVIWRMSHSGNINGYVQVPESHRLHGLDYDTRIKLTPEIAAQELHEIAPNYIALLCEACKNDELIGISSAISVHGGVTYAGNLRGQEGWWFGFDTAHYQDVSPGREYYMEGAYRNWEYVMSEIAALSAQLKLLENVEVPKDKEAEDETHS